MKKRVLESIRPKNKRSVAEFHNPLSRQYEGKIFIDTFQINQVIVERRNSLAPLITGKINLDTDATNIEIKMELLPFAKTFMSLYLVLTGIACIILLLIGFLQLMQVLHNAFEPFTLIPFILFIGGLYILFAGFKSQSENSKYYLAKLLEGQQVESA